MRMFFGLDQIAFFVARHCDRTGLGYIVGNYAWAVGVRTGWPNYIEPWAFRKEVA